MKKILLVLFACLVCYHTFAQKPYIKHIIGTGRSHTTFQNWESEGRNHSILTDIDYTFFVNKNIGIRLAYHVNTREVPKGASEKYQYLPPGEQYYYSRYVHDRRINCLEYVGKFYLIVNN